MALERRDDLPAAADAFAKAATHQSSAIATAPQLPRGQELLAKHRANENRIKQKLGNRTDSTRQSVQPTSEIDYTDSVSGIERNSSLLSRTR
jgi:hypothetical protein